MAEPACVAPTRRKHATALPLNMALLLLGVFLLLSSQRSTPATQAATGAVQGTVSIGGLGDPAGVTGAKVILMGDTSIRSTVTNQEGRFAFDGLQPGIYLVEASYFGLHSQMNVKVEVDLVAQVALQLPAAEGKR